MKLIVAISIIVFSSLAYASDFRGLAPYAVGTMLLVITAIYSVVFHMTKTVANRWHRFYIRVLSTPALLAVLLMYIGINFYALVPLVVCFMYILVFRVFTEWLRK